MRKRSRIQNLSLCLGGLALVGAGQQVSAQIAVDGTLDAGYGSVLATQTINTGFGDSTIGDGTSGGGSELDAGYGVVQNGELYVFLAGNFENNGNHVNIFINDGRANGQQLLNASTASGNLNNMNGSVFSPGFNATYAIDANDFNNTLFIDQYDLVNNTANFSGSVPLTGGIGNNQNVGGLKVALNNTNAAGVVGDGGTGTAADPTAANAVHTGLEIGIPLLALGNPAAGSNIQIMADINGGGNNFLSNQFLAGLPVGTSDVGGGGALTGPSAGTFNLSGVNNGWFSVGVPSAPNGTWLPTGSGDWGTSTNWSGGAVPHLAGDNASFSSATANATVSLATNFSVGSMSIDDTNSYTFASTGGSLVFDNGANAATLTDFGGTHTISAPMVLNSATSVTVVNHGDNMILSGNISGAGGLSVKTLGGGGAQALSQVLISGNNTYSGGTTVDGGNLQLGSATALPANSALTLSAQDLPSGVLDLNNFSASVSSITVLTGPNTIPTGSVAQIINTSATAGTATFTYAGTNANPSEFTGNITDSAATGGGTTALAITSGSLTLSGNNTYAGGTSVSSGATLALSSTAGTSLPTGSNISNDGSLVVNDTIAAGNITGTGTTTVNAAMSLSAIGLSQAGGLVNNGSTTVSGGGTVGPVSGTGTLTVGGDLKLASGSGLSTQGGLVINTGGDLDITNNHMIISYADGTQAATDASIRDYLTSGYAGGNWNGVSGIISSTAAAKPGFAIGYADGADGVVAGLSSGQIELKYTIYGDANLDGLVSGVDFTILVGNLGKSVNAWDQGDFNYDGVVSGIDFTALVGNLGKAANGADVTLPAADIAAIDAFAAANGLMASVPEPVTGAMMLVAGAGMMMRRRRK